MLRTIVYVLAALLILTYTISYAVYEFKNKNILAGVGVIAICAALVLTPVGIVLYF